VDPLAIVGWAAVAFLVVGWLVVSYSKPSPRRTAFEWLSASALYLALLMLFTNLSLKAHANGSTVALVLFLFLGVMFASGLVITLYNAATSGRAPKTGPSATN